MTKFAQALMGTLLALGFVVLGAPAAPASSASTWDCPYGRVCLYDGYNGTGDRYVVPACGYDNLPSYWWDKANSLRTYGNETVLYTWNPERNILLNAGGAPVWSQVNLTSPNRADVVFVRC